MAKIDKKDLGYLGEDFQYKLIHEFMSNKDFFKDINGIVDQNMFTNPPLKTFVGIMKDYYEREEAVPSYQIMGIALNNKAYNDVDREILQATLKKIQETPSDGSEYIKELSTKFFKQQNIIKTANEILKIAGNGDTTRYEECVELLNNALNQGTHTEFGSTVFDDIGETLSNEYRVAIPTGIGKIDEALEGGLGKGELGVIIGSTGFGKALSVDETVITPSGFERMGDIKVGDFVIGRDGKPTKVLGVFPQGARDLYRVTFSDGSSCVCDMEHLWNVNSLNRRMNGDESYETITLKEIVERGVDSEKFRIPICDSVDFKKDEDADFETFVKFMKGKIDDTEYFFKNTLFSSATNRILFLLGIASEHSEKRFVVKYKELLPNIDKNRFVYWIKQILYSLGYTPNVTNDSIEVNLSDKHKERIITSVDFVKNGDAVCILVDNDEHLFLTNDFIVTHNTSMTTAMASYASTYKCEQNNYDGYKVIQIVFEDRIKQIQRKHIGRITGVEAKDLSKPDVIDKVREQLAHYEDKEMMAKNLRIVRFPSGEITASSLSRFLKKMINNGFKPDMVVIDYFECLSHEGITNSTNDFEKEGKTMRRLEALAGEMDIALWVPSQGTKDSLNLELVTIDKMGGSVKKAQIAHIIMSIARTVEDVENSKATIAVLKNRAGKSGKVFNNVEFNNGTCRISTDNIDEFENMMDFNKNKQKENTDLAISVYKSMKQRN